MTWRLPDTKPEIFSFEKHVITSLPSVKRNALAHA